ncbi:MAG: DNA-methyltransferase [Candidatus Hodarchaeales archaeon]|jgi:site-specific DNA-methyltransferase (adenine-specific)
MPRKKERKKTHTSSFGVSSRESHDSSRFYRRKIHSHQPLNQNNEYEENVLPSQLVNNIYNKSAESMEELPDNSIHLIISSPPYNVGKEYDSDVSMEEYLNLLKRVWQEINRILIPGGRVCINIANLGRKPYIPLHTYIISDFLELGFLMRGEVIWDKSASAGTSTAWGSWKSSSNPTLRDVHEYILIFSKDLFKRNKTDNSADTISRDEFLTNTKSIWTFPAVSAKKIGHPAPFPIELPYRLIQLYSFKGDIVLDPFMGSGQTAIAALKSSRRYIGYETNQEYINLANERINQFKEDQRRKQLDNFLPSFKEKSE